MNATILMAWGLWVISGGGVNSGYLQQPQVVAYFSTEAGCARTLEHVRKLMVPGNSSSSGPRPMQCIQAEYVIVGVPK
jgi:hypothetical protein